ncbi:hypothetical protein KSF_061400 [Reticulibacter mediterranei]|uniref:TIR domain-containing protein n=1 Tax=Reticulibacter mediterranei TaxID=2778369 RepID=A0A8J3N6H0_9CHLR|nr:TIR domain-containing protein [Reticulibacter mediterranei]GHO96092.1 hypothetical protein KSF_061400 [Reticulibacter mediterranei]
MSTISAIASAPEIFYCYTHSDEPLSRELEKHLKLLQRQGFVSTWHRYQIDTDMKEAEVINRHLNTASVILLLLSVRFLASDFCFSVEIQRAVQRHEAGEARVIPILLRPVDLGDTPFEKLSMLPSEGKPITSWSNRDEAFLEVVKGIKEALESIQKATLPIPSAETLRDFFISYAAADRSWAEWIAWQLEEAGYTTVIQVWDFLPGRNFISEMNAAVKTARRTIAIISPEYLSSAFTQSEWTTTFQRDPTGSQGLLIPVVVEPSDVSGFLGSIVYVNLVGLDKLSARAQLLASIGNTRSKPKTAPVFPGSSARSGKDSEPPFPVQDTHQLFDVFVKSGFPYITYVEREDFGLLKLSLAQPGRGVIIEGPSGVGKTTALKKAIEELTHEKPLSADSSVLLLSAREQEHQASIETLVSWHNGTVIIDDFHRLSPATSKKIVDYLKYLADTEPESKKLVIVGIPQTGQMLVDISFDIATRIDVFKWGKVEDELILRMIEQGEQALNIELTQKSEIISASSGSLNIAQFLCFNICYKQRIIKTQEQKRTIHCTIDTAISYVIIDLSRKFGELTRRFTAMGGYRDITCLRLLEALAASGDGFVSLARLKEQKPNLAEGIERFIDERWIDKLSEVYPISKHHLFFDPTLQALVVEDPQFTFYLNNIQFNMLEKEVGKTNTPLQRPVGGSITNPLRDHIFISYSHKDKEWLDKLLTMFKPLERQGLLKTWSDTLIAPGSKWKDEINTALASAKVALLLVSPDFLASDFIANHELPPLLDAAEKKGLVILWIAVSYSMYKITEIVNYQAVNNPSEPLDSLTTSSRVNQELVLIAEKVREILHKR